MRNWILVLCAMLASVAIAHDGGHGPKVTDTGKYGGLISGVVLKSDFAKGEKAELVYKAELSRAEGTLRLYLYDKDMKALDLKAFEPSAKGVLGTRVKGKWTETPLQLELKGNAFLGKMPKPKGRPYNIDLTLSGNGQELLTAFDNLD